MAGDGAIFFMEALAETEALILANNPGRLVEFGRTATVPDARAMIARISSRKLRKSTMQPAPFNELVRKPDTGPGGTEVTLELVFFEAPPILAGAISRINEFMDATNTNRIFRRGVIGLRLNRRPDLNVIPTAGKGYKITEFYAHTDLQYSVTTATLKLESAGSEA